MAVVKLASLQGVFSDPHRVFLPFDGVAVVML